MVEHLQTCSLKTSGFSCFLQHFDSVGRLVAGEATHKFDTACLNQKRMRMNEFHLLFISVHLMSFHAEEMLHFFLPLPIHRGGESK